MTLDPESFRRAMRAWTTGVAVLMSAHEGETYGMTVNSFASLSLDPPMATVALRNESRLFGLVTKSRAFSVTILSSDQRELAENFAGKMHGGERMASVATRTLASGAPALADGLAWLDCRVVHTWAAGENTLFITEVTEARVRSTENPLVYHNREYRQLV